MIDFLTVLREANLARQDEWTRGKNTSLSFKGNELAGETGEACNVVKKLERKLLGMVTSEATVGDLAEELADVIICVDLLASDFNIDLAQAVEEKFNKTSKKYGLEVTIER